VVQDTPTLLFDFEAPAEEAEAAVAVVSTWTPPAPEPAPIAVPLLLLEEPAQVRAVVQVAEPARAVAPAPPADGPLPAWASALGVFDLETTGVDTSTARIVTAHVGVIDETGAVVERKDWIVNPGVPIPEGAAAVHGITDDRAQRFGRPPGEVVAEILAAIRSVFLRGFPLVVFNAPYDLTLLAAEAERHRLWPLETTAPVVDPFVLDKEVDRFRKGKRTLTAAAEVYGVDLTDAHDAGADAIAAGRVAQAIARRYSDVLSLEAHELHDAQVAWCADQADRFQAYMREKRDPGFTTSGSWPKR
jgi:DNA polymerase-3 subunit epsilon